MSSKKRTSKRRPSHNAFFRELSASLAVTSKTIVKGGRFARNKRETASIERALRKFLLDVYNTGYYHGVHGPKALDDESRFNPGSQMARAMKTLAKKILDAAMDAVAVEVTEEVGSRARTKN